MTDYIEIEKNFNISFTDQDLNKMVTLRDVTNFIYKNSLAKNRKNLTIKDDTYSDKEKIQTLNDVLFHFAINDPDKKHLYFYDEFENETAITYGELLDNALKIANTLRKNGVNSNDRIALMLPSSPLFFYTFFGVLLANCVPILMEPPLYEEGSAFFVRISAQVLQKQNAIFLITNFQHDGFSGLIKSTVPGLKEVFNGNILTENEGEKLYTHPGSGDLALIYPRYGKDRESISYTHHEILAKICSYAKDLKLTHDDIGLIWTPIYSCESFEIWLECFYHSLPLFIMPTHFILKKPEKLLWSIHNSNATIAGGRRAIYELCLKISPALIEALDLSSWRLALNINDTVSQNLQEKFFQKFVNYGFKKECFFSTEGFLKSNAQFENLLDLDHQFSNKKQIFQKKEEGMKTSLSFIFFLKKTLYYFFQGLKFFYSLYVGLIFFLLIPPAYIAVMILNADIGSKILHYWARLSFILIFCPIKIYNKEDLDLKVKVIYASNHTSYFDTLLFMAILPPKTRIVGKNELGHFPLIGSVILKVGHILIDRKTFPKGIRQSIEKIKMALERNSILIFPEGTFSYAEGLRPFKLGTFKIACDQNVPIVPLAVQGTRRILRDGDYLLRPMFLKVFVGNPLIPTGNQFNDYIKLKKAVRKYISLNCGEPSLDFIVASKDKANLS